MKLKLNTSLVPLFSGTYGTIWEDAVSELTQDGTELETEYDFNEFLKSIAHVYSNHEDEILEALEVSFVKSIKFLGTFFSPREYNFSTDSLDFEVEIDKTQLLAELKQLEDNGDFKKWLEENYSSRSGFISFTPDNYAELLDNIVNEGDHLVQSVSAIIRYLSPEFDKLSDSNVEASIYEDYRANGYGGLDYKVVCSECGEELEYYHGIDEYLCSKCNPVDENKIVIPDGQLLLPHIK